MIVQARAEADGFTVYLFENGGVHLDRDDSMNKYLHEEEAVAVKEILDNNV